MSDELPSRSAPLVYLTSGPKGSIHSAVAPGVTRLRDTHTTGLSVLVGKTKRTYAVKVRVKGRPGQLVIRLGDVAKVGLADARREAADIVDKARQGIVPERAADRKVREQRAAREVARAAQLATERELAGTFKAVANEYLDDDLDGGGARLASRPELLRKLKTELAEWHDRPVAEITRADIKKLVREKAKASKSSANRLLSFIKRVFAWAEDQDYIEDNPALGIKKPAAESGRDRYLDDNEIRLFWKACDAIGDPAGRLFQLCLVTGQRRGEVAGLKRSELGLFEFKNREGKATSVRAWLLPAERTKRRRDHGVPLSPLAARLIDGAPKFYDEDGKLYDHLLVTDRRADQPPSGWSKFKRQLDEAMGKIIADEAGEPFDPERHVIPPFVIHDLRATCASHLEMEEVDGQIISRILNHAEGDGKSTTKKYKRYAFDQEAADALKLWAEKLERLTGANVVSLDGARA